MTRKVTFSLHAEHFPLINLEESLALGWPFTIIKAPNPMGKPACSKEHLATFKNSYPASSMARSSAHCSVRQNLLFDNNDKLAG